ncbi:MAG: glycosyltransferase [Phycisphaerales bacterium]
MAKIALVSSEVAPLHGWGAGTYAALVTLALSRAGHEVHLFTDAPGAAEHGGSLFPGVRIHQLERLGCERCKAEGFDNSHQASGLEAMRALEAEHAREPFAIVEFPDIGGEAYFTLRAREAWGALPGAVLAVRTHQCNHILRALNRWPWENRWFASLRAMERFCLARADVLLAPSARVRSIVDREISGAAARTLLARIPFSDDLLVGEQEIAAARAPQEGEPPRVLCTGRLEHLKGVEHLVRAAVEVLSRGIVAKFVLVGADTFTGPGGGWMLAHLESLIPPEFRGAFEFHSKQMPRIFVAAELRRATLCCCPSLEDNFPYGVLEAMHAGRAIITTDGCGVSEVLQDGRDALIVPAANSGALSDAICRLLADPALRDRLGAAARETVARECDPSRVVRVYDELRPGPVRVVAGQPRGGVTIVIPAIGGSRYLTQALRSVREQTVAPDAIVLVEGPGRSSIEDASVKRVQAREGGVAGALNAGIAAATTRWIVPLRPEDLLEPRFIERTLDAAARNEGLACVATLALRFDDADPSLRTVSIPLGLERDQLPVWNCAGPLSALVARAALDAVGGYDIAMDELFEWDLWCGLANRGYRSVVVPEFLVIERHGARPPLTRRRAEMLRAIMLAKHTGLSANPELTMRMLVGELLTDEDLDGRPDPRDVAFEIVRTNLRYRLADRLNAAAKKLGVQGVLKGLARDGSEQPDKSR